MTNLAGVGVAAAVVGVMCSSVALMVMKLSADKEKDLPLRRRKRFFIGFALQLSGEVGLSSLALALAPMAMIAPIPSLSIPFAAILARTGWLSAKETMGAVQYASAAIVIGGVVVTSLFGPGASGEAAEPRIERLPHVFGAPPFLVYTCLHYSLAIGWLCVQKVGALWRVRDRLGGTSKALVSGYCAATLASQRS